MARFKAEKELGPSGGWIIVERVTEHGPQGTYVTYDRIAATGMTKADCKRTVAILNKHQSWDKS